MVNCSHNPGDVGCIILYLVGYIAAVVTCAICIAVVCYIVKRNSKQRRDNLKCDEESPPDVFTITKVNTQYDTQGYTNKLATIEDLPRATIEDNPSAIIEDNPTVILEQNCPHDANGPTVFSTCAGLTNKEEKGNPDVQTKLNCNDTQGVISCTMWPYHVTFRVRSTPIVHPIQGLTNKEEKGNPDVHMKQNCLNDTQWGTCEQKLANHVGKPSKTKDNRKRVFVLLKDDILKECIVTLFKGTGLIPDYIHFDNKQAFDENEKFESEDKTSTIVVVRHGSTRIDSDIEGCCKHVADSDMKRTVVVIINEYANNKKGEHGEIIKPNSYVIDYINDLKNVVILNYKCCMEKTKCKLCKNAMDEFKQHAKSPNYK